MTWQDRAMQLKTDGKTYNEIASQLNSEYLDEQFSYCQVRGWLRRHNKTGEPKKEPFRKKTEYRNDGSVLFESIIELFENDVVTPEKLLEAHGLDISQWTVINCTNNYWESQIKGGRKIVLYQSKLTAKPIQNSVSTDVIRSLFDELNRETPAITADYPMAEHSKMAEVNIADLHLGKLCWHGNTGENYDHKIAKKNFESIVERICEELQGMGLEYILFVWSNDYFNSDNEESTTTKGTPQDTDIRFEKLFKAGTKMLVWAIERFKQIAPVKTFRIPSNHDNVLSLSALVVLQAWFRNDKQVTISDDSTPRKYILFGNSLTGFCHGDTEGRESKNKEKASRLASLMPIEARGLWGKALYCEMHAGHLHSEQMINEINGVIVRRISSPTASDTWHVNSAYVGSTRKAQTFIYDAADGIIKIIHTPIRQVDRILS